MRVPPATLSTTGHRRSQPRLTRKLKITSEDAIREVPDAAWQPGIRQDGSLEDDKDIAEITHLLARAGNWPNGLRWIANENSTSRPAATPASASRMPLKPPAIGILSAV